jgi:hypothetical protein
LISTNTKLRAPYLIPQTGRRVRHLDGPNIYKFFLPCPCAYLRVLGLPITILHNTIYYLRYPLGRFAGLKHRQLVCQVGVIITTERIRRTIISKINLLVAANYSSSCTCVELKRDSIPHAYSELQPSDSSTKWTRA